MEESRRYCTFHLQDFFFGVPVERVQEVIRYQEMTDVPLASPVVSGLINLRGQIVTALDLRRRLELEDREEGGRLPTNVVIQTEGGTVSLLVDKIADVLEVDEDIFEPPPENLEGEARELILGAYKLSNRLLLVLDIEKTLTVNGPEGAAVEAA